MVAEQDGLFGVFLVDELDYVVDLHAICLRCLSAVSWAFLVASFASCSALQFFTSGVSSSCMSMVTVMGFCPSISTSMSSVWILFKGILDLM